MLKGAADQYVRDYARIFGLKTTVFRQSCIYGSRQFGIEDQGWIAWFTLASMLGKPLTIYGNGKQIRDILWIEDICDLYFEAWEIQEEVSGKIFIVGGGKSNCLSLLELIDLLQDLLPSVPVPEFDEWRPGDQKVYFYDISKVSRSINWSPKTTPMQGLEKLVMWAKSNLDLIRQTLVF